MKTRALVALLVCGVAIVGGACSSSGDVKVQGVQGDTTDQPSLDLKGSSIAAAAAGPDLVVVDVTRSEDRGKRKSNLRTAEGRWEELAPIPLGGHVAVGSVGDTVAVAGAKCADPDCEAVVPEFALLDRTSREWKLLSGPSTELPSSLDATEVSSFGQAGQQGYFSVGNRQFIVSPRGEVRSMPDFPKFEGETGQFLCVIEDVAVVIPYVGESEPGAGGALTMMRVAGAGYTLDLTTGSTDWEDRGSPPVRLLTRYGDVCGPTGLTIQNLDAEVTLSTTGEWTTGPSNYAELAGGIEMTPTGPGAVAVRKGSSPTVVVAWNGILLARSAESSWRSLDEPGTAVYATSAEILSYDSNTGQFARIEGV